MRQLTLGVQLKERATFASFLTARNQELVAHLRHVAATTPPGSTWLAGPHSSGKSHLLQAVCAELDPGRRAAYLPLETLLPFGPGTLDGAETLDLACCDDVQSVAGLDAWEQRLFSLWQRAQERGATLLFAARAAARYGPLVHGAPQGHAAYRRRLVGRVKRKVAPPRALFSAQIEPPWACTMVREIDRPSPMPSALLV